MIYQMRQRKSHLKVLFIGFVFRVNKVADRNPHPIKGKRLEESNLSPSVSIAPIKRGHNVSSNLIPFTLSCFSILF